MRASSLSSPRPRRPAAWLRLAALALVASFASLSAATSGCALIEGAQDCEKACDQLSQCGVLKSGSCGAYCASLVSGAAIAGCADELDAQNACGKSLDGCTTAAAMCAPQVEAFSKCMDAYCKKTPGGQGCP